MIRIQPAVISEVVVVCGGHADLSIPAVSADFSGSEPDTALMEEREALAIQRKMAEQLADEDFGLDIFKASSGTVIYSRVPSILSYMLIAIPIFPTFV